MAERSGPRYGLHDGLDVDRQGPADYDRRYDTVDRITMPLLQRITVQSLDEDYAHVAARRRETGVEPTERPRSVAWWVWLAVTVLVGGLLAVAGRQTSAQALDSESGRATLIDRLEGRQADLRSTQERVARVQ